MTTDWRVTVASPPDREGLVAEVFFGDVQWAEINQDSGTLEVEFYPRPDGGFWCLPLETVFAALLDAKSRLIG